MFTLTIVFPITKIENGACPAVLYRLTLPAAAAAAAAAAEPGCCLLFVLLLFKAHAYDVC